MVQYFHHMLIRIAFYSFTIKICADFYRLYMKKKYKSRKTSLVIGSHRPKMYFQTLRVIPKICVSVQQVNLLVHQMGYSMFPSVNMVLTFNIFILYFVNLIQIFFVFNILRFPNYAEFSPFLFG